MPWFVVIFGKNTTSDISKLLYVISRATAREIWDSFEISLVAFMPNITTNHAIICLYYYPQTHRYLTFINHTFVSSCATSRAIESRGKTRAKEQTILWRTAVDGSSLLRYNSICRLCGLSRLADFVLITNPNVSESSATGIYFYKERI